MKLQVIHFLFGFIAFGHQSTAFTMNLEPTFCRRDIIGKIASSFVIGSFTKLDKALAEDKEPTIWKSGKTPIVSGVNPKKKNDVKGTRKDSSFLRSIAQCKNQCESKLGLDGFAVSKEECLSECQDICCTTYEQCTFAIVPRI